MQNWFLGLAILLAGCSVLFGAERPNFVVIMADDLGYGDLSCYGSQRILTPHIDRLADQGVRFTDFHSSGAVCSPTRAGLMTGRYQQRAGIPAVIVADPTRPTHPHGLQDQEITFAELLARAGYQTGIFGKWHLGYYTKYNPVRHGFQEFRGYISGNVDYFSHVDQAGRLDWWHNDQISDEPGYTTHLITRHVLSFLQTVQDQPFCLYVAYEPPHYPYQGPHDQPVRRVGQKRGAAERDQSDAEIERAYREMVVVMDSGVGEIVDALAKHGLSQKTFVFFFSDNGATPRGSNGELRGHKGQLWEGGHRVPFVAWRPGAIAPGRVVSELAISLDVMPTLLDAAGVSCPRNHRLDGTSLLPLLVNQRPLAKRKLFWQHGTTLAMRDSGWKLVVPAGKNRVPSLFDLPNDLSEQNDLAHQHPLRVKEMMSDLRRWQADVSASATEQPLLPPAGHDE
jgi:arylsulfatase A